MRKLFIFLCLGLVFLFSTAQSQTSLAQLKKENNVLIGSIHLKFWFWSIYDASLFSTKKPFSYNNTFLLEITYLRDFSSIAIAKESIKQIKKQHPDVSDTILANWQNKLLNIFPNIKENDQLIGYYNSQGYAFFYNKQGKFLGKINNQIFSRYFFDIWLSDKAENLKLSRQLRGL